ncbi:hypothetical protein C8R44DRAFT_805548 [Mycena epipterygia]|nr:hypothetical protein C8R44DRAFT_805548 [Mycena epipterygia]
MPVDPDEAVDNRIRRVRNRRIGPRTGIQTFALFCGAEQPPGEGDFDAHRPWRVQILPMEDSPPPAKRQKITKSNGCGALIHTAARPTNGRLAWGGSHAEMTDVVLALEDKYVPPALQDLMKTRRDSCGCLRSPVGCAACGNPLGALITHCNVHTYFDLPPTVCEFADSAVSPPLPSESTLRTTPTAPLPRATYGVARQPDPANPGGWVYRAVAVPDMDEGTDDFIMAPSAEERVFHTPSPEETPRVASAGAVSFDLADVDMRRLRPDTPEFVD